MITSDYFSIERYCRIQGRHILLSLHLRQFGVLAGKNIDKVKCLEEENLAIGVVEFSRRPNRVKLAKFPQTVLGLSKLVLVIFVQQRIDRGLSVDRTIDELFLAN